VKVFGVKMAQMPGWLKLASQVALLSQRL